MKPFDLNEYYSGSKENPLYLKNKALHFQWKKFIEGSADFDPDLVSPETLQEWNQCRALKIDPLKNLTQTGLFADALQEKLAENMALINISQPFLHRLFQFFKDFSYAVGLFDREGYVLKVITEEKYLMNNRMFNFLPGSVWNYATSGNSGLACVLDQAKPRQIIGANHYLKILHFVAASAAPILDAEGKLLGGIIVTTFYTDSHPHTLGMVATAAQAIENEWRAQKKLLKGKTHFNETGIAASLQKAMLSALPEALIVLGHDGVITTANEKARLLFGLNVMQAVPVTLSSFFNDAQNRPFLAAALEGESVVNREVRIRTSQGEGDYFLSCKNVLLSGGEIAGRMLMLSDKKTTLSQVSHLIGARAKCTFDDLCGQGESFQRILDPARAVSQSDSPVLLQGESGTGKSVLASAIHHASSRRDNPFLTVSLADIPREWLACELFGDEGAAAGLNTGATPGKVELADGGTIFLDEIAEAPLEVQDIILGLLKEKSFIRPGGAQSHTANVRLIFATTRDLLIEVHRGHFRAELYNQINRCHLKLPPLRERPDDLLPLVKKFLAGFSSCTGKMLRGADETVLEMFRKYRWPGNIRELRRVIEHMAHSAASGLLTMEALPPELLDPTSAYRRHREFVSPEETEKSLISHLLTLKFPKKDIARELNISRAHLYRKMKKFGLTEPGAPE